MAERRTADRVEEARGGRIMQCSAVVAAPRGTDALLLNVNGGRRMTLDVFGSRVWFALDVEPTLPALVTRLMDEGPPAQRVAEDVTRLLARWRADGLITWR
jgi:hypothetical protein